MIVLPRDPGRPTQGVCSAFGASAPRPREMGRSDGPRSGVGPAGRSM